MKLPRTKWRRQRDRSGSGPHPGQSGFLSSQSTSVDLGMKINFNALDDLEANVHNIFDF